MHAREESSGTGTSRRNNRDFDDFDELDDGELAPDEENEFAVRYLEGQTRTRMSRRKAMSCTRPRSQTSCRDRERELGAGSWEQKRRPFSSVAIVPRRGYSPVPKRPRGERCSWLPAPRSQLFLGL